MKLICLALLVPALLVAGVVQTFDAPDTGITGLAWGDGVLWAVDGTTQYVYGIDPSNGSVLSSFLIVDQTPSLDPIPGGLAYLNGTIYVAMHYSNQYGQMYKYSTDGTYNGSFDVYC